MKKLIVLILLLLLSHNNFAQQSDNSQVDLRAMCNQRIEQIKQNTISNENSRKKIVNNSTVKSAAGFANKATSAPLKISSFPQKRKSEPKENNIVLLKIFVLFEATLLAGIIVLYRRKKLGFKKLETKELKKNIKKLREENLIVSNNTSLNELRKSLSSKDLPIKDGAKGITLLAKKLAIAKGEVYLAAKISLLASK